MKNEKYRRIDDVEAEKQLWDMIDKKTIIICSIVLGIGLVIIILSIIAKHRARK
jgi:hypothetical protein